MNKPLLSICILTYNRTELLREAVKSILMQAEEGLREKVEIIISDNAATATTASMVAELSRIASLEIRYFQNEKNVGFDGNCLLAVERARGDYVWLLGDDDLLAEGSLASVCEELERSPEIDVFLGEKEDFYLTVGQPMRKRRIMNFRKAKVFDFRQPRLLDEYFEANKKLIAYLNFISIIVFKREKWLQIKCKENYVGTGYIHVYVWQSILWAGKRGQLKYLPFALARRRWGTDPDYDIEKKLKMDFQMFHRIAEAVFTDRKYRWMIDDLVIRNDGFSWAVRVKLLSPGRFLTVHLPFLFKSYWDHPLFWLKIFSLIFVPSFLLRFMRGTYRRLVKREPVVFREFLEG